MPSIETLGTVLPGDIILHIDPKVLKEVHLGPGLRWQDNKVKSTRAGLLKKDNKIYFVDSFQKRYIPQKREFVVGIVIKKKGENYLIDIGAHESATISYLAFENASKKTRTELKLGDLIYGQLLVADKDMEPELVCIDINYRSIGMGPLPSEGILFNVPLHVARSIVNPECPFLLKLSQLVNYSIVVGFNGRIWLRAKKHIEMVALMHTISMLEFLSVEEAESNIEAMYNSFFFNSLIK